VRHASGPLQAVVVLILGDIRQQREKRERPNDRARAGWIEQIERGLQLLFGLTILISPESDGCLPNLFDQREVCLSFLFEKGFSEQAPEHADVIAKRSFLVDS
jgi:hypothetical protein